MTSSQTESTYRWFGPDPIGNGNPDVLSGHLVDCGIAHFLFWLDDNGWNCHHWVLGWSSDGAAFLDSDETIEHANDHPHDHTCAWPLISQRMP